MQVSGIPEWEGTNGGEAKKPNITVNIEPPAFLRLYPRVPSYSVYS